MYLSLLLAHDETESVSFDIMLKTHSLQSASDDLKGFSCLHLQMRLRLVDISFLTINALLSELVAIK